MNNLPSLQQSLMQAIFFVCIGVFVYLMTRWLKFRHEPWPYSNPEQSAWVAIGTIILPWSLLILIGLLSSLEVIETSTSIGIKNSPATVRGQLIAYLILFTDVTHEA